jgi:(S)-sulfolactate dehydrogenase
MSRIVVSEYLQDDFLTRIGEDFDVVYDPDLYADRPRLLRETADAVAVIIRNRTRIDRRFLESACSLKLVGRLGVGLDNIDMTACSARGVTVIPAVGANAVSVAEYVMAAMLILVRGVFGMTESMVAGEWPRQGHAFGRELMGSTLGLVGLGSIGRSVATRSAALGMKVIAYDPHLLHSDPAWQLAERVGLDQLLAEADVVSLHIPRNEATANLIDAAALAQMKTSAVLINTSRGGVVDEIALSDALRSGVIGGAAIDVFESEPLEPEPAARFRGLKNLILTPHVAGNTDQSVHRVAEMITSAVLESLQSDRDGPIR